MNKTLKLTEETAGGVCIRYYYQKPVLLYKEYVY